MKERLWLWFGAAALTSFAFVLVWFVGHRGLCLFDHSIIFDGGYRILQGQVPYRDFYLAFLPGSLWVQALFFRLYGVDFSAMVLPAAIFNSFAVAAVIRIVWLLFPGRVVAALVGGWLTALWFQAPIGCLFPEQTSFTFNLAALLLLLEANGRSARSEIPRFMAGMAVGAAILCKQNSGGFFVPVCLVVLVLQFMPDCRRTGQGVLMFMLGLAVVLGAFLLWVLTASDFGQFRLYAWEIPSQLASKRAWGNLPNFIRTLLWFEAPLGALLFNPVCLLVSAAGFAVGMMTSFRDDEFRRRLRIASAATVSILAYQNLFQVTTLHDVENDIPFVGLAFALATAVAGELFYNRKLELGSRGRQDALFLEVRPKHVNLALVTIGGVLLLILSRQGLRVDFQRTVNSFVPSARFERRLQLPRIARVMWGEPTRFGLKQADFENVVRWLERKKGNFFVFPDAAILYGLVGRASPQPMLYFQRGQSYRETDVPRLEDEILGSLRRNNVRTVVLEKGSVFEDVGIASFPKLNRWIRSEFERSHEFGLFDIWEKR